MRLIDGIIRMHFDISKLVTSSNVINYSLRHRKLNMASLKSMTAKMRLQGYGSVVIRTHNCNWTIIERVGQAQFLNSNFFGSCMPKVYPVSKPTFSVLSP